MPFLKRTKKDCISSNALADFGRLEILGPELSGVATVSAYGLVEPLVASCNMDAKGESGAIEELRRHVVVGEWEAVGGWKFTREFMRNPDAASDVIDIGLRALARMRVTNLAFHLPPIDKPRYEELTGRPVPNDGFFGPPTFESNFGPSRQYYFDQALLTALSRRVKRLTSHPGVEPGPVEEAAKSMWAFGLLIFRGPLVVNPEIRFEARVVRPAVLAATEVDHSLFLSRLADHLAAGPGEYPQHWALMGAARFVEDYLDSELVGCAAHVRLVDLGLRELIGAGALGLAMSVDILSPVERARLNLMSLADRQEP